MPLTKKTFSALSRIENALCQLAEYGRNRELIKQGQNNWKPKGS